MPIAPPSPSQPPAPPSAPAAETPSLPRTLQAAARALGASGDAAGSARLLGLLCDPDISFDKVVACLRSEPALTARVLKVANSPFYGRSGEVGTLEHAAQLLGLAAIRGIAAAGCLDRVLPSRCGEAFDPDRFRRHSLAVGVAAQSLAQAAGLGVAPQAFIAGLLLDIGVLLLAQADRAAMARYAPPRGAAPEAELAAERAHFGTDRAHCAWLLLETWRLPAWLADPLCRRLVAPQPLAGRDDALNSLPAVVLLADHVAAQAGLGLWPEPAPAHGTGTDPGAPSAEGREAAGAAPALPRHVAEAAAMLGLDVAVIAHTGAALPGLVERMAGAP